jgi:hypothetical protein
MPDSVGKSMKKSLLFLLLLTLLTTLFFPFGKWRTLDDLRFDCIDSLARLKFHVVAPYDAKSLLEKTNAEAPTWMKEQLEKDLHSFRLEQNSNIGLEQKSNISLKSLMDTYMKGFSKEDLQNNLLLIRFTVKNGKLSSYPETLNRFQGRLAAVQDALMILNKEKLLPEGLDFILCINDKVFEGYQGEVPIFVFSKNVEDPRQRNLILMPDGMNLSRWAYNYDTIRFANSVFPWDKKKNIVLWRGSNTNPIREKIVSLPLPFVDAKMTDGRDAAYMIPEYQIQYKYLLSLDGISSTWPGFLWKLASNAVTFKQASPHVQWYYGGLKPGVHYVPVAADLSDLEMQYRWAEAHPEEVKKISENAQEFVAENLTYEDMLHYMTRVLRGYKNLQNGKTKDAREVSPVEKEPFKSQAPSSL